VTAVRFFYVADEDTVIGSVRFNEAMLPAAIDRAVPLVEPGAVVSPPPKGTVFGRVALATAAGDSVQECAHALDLAAAALEIKPA